MVTIKRTAASPRKIALWAGVLYLLTFVSIPTLSLYSSIHNANYITGPGPDTPVFIGGILEIIVALAGIGTAVVLFPVLKMQNEALALGLWFQNFRSQHYICRRCLFIYGRDFAAIREC